jgi:hypothetical protein
MKASMGLIITVWTLLWVVPERAWADFQPEAGFVSLEATECHFQSGSYFNRVALRTSPARIWTVFQPADEDPAAKPLFVFFNGGPCHATCDGLMSANTAPRAVALDERTGSGVVMENPSRWTRIGNLLYVDSRNAGFSYCLMENPEDAGRRRQEFDAQNYNAFIDGADFVRVVIRFLAAHPRLQRNRVVIVGESYGGTRATVMLHLLLYYRTYANGMAPFQDESLVGEIQDHLESVFPQYRGQTVPPRTIAAQFSHQVLIQPALSNPNQHLIATRLLETPGSILYRLADETGIPYVPCKDQPGASPTPTVNQILDNIYAYLEEVDRDPYLCAKPAGYLDAFFASAAQQLSRYDSLCRLIGRDVADVDGMYAQARLNACRMIADGSPAAPPAPASDWESRLLRRRHAVIAGQLADRDDLEDYFGILNPWDGYYLEFNPDANQAFVINRLTFSCYYIDVYWGVSQMYGRMFLEDAAWVETFITDSEYDLVVFAPAIPEALSLHASTLSASRHDRSGPPGAERPGRILLSYRPGSVPGSQVGQRTIRFPHYSRSGHAVTLTEPAELLADVTSWLGETGGTRAECSGE